MFADEHYLEAQDALRRAKANGLSADMRTAWATIAIAHLKSSMIDPRVFEAAMHLQELNDE
jgi:hypothetical protein